MDEDSMTRLAMAVLKKAVADEEHEAPFLRFWCDFLGIEYSVFLSKAKLVVGDESD